MTCYCACGVSRPVLSTKSNANYMYASIKFHTYSDFISAKQQQYHVKELQKTLNSIRERHNLSWKPRLQHFTGNLLGDAYA